MDQFQFMNEEIVFLEGNGITIELIKANPENNVYAAHFAFKVNDLKKTIDDLKNKGFYPSEGPFIVENKWKTVFYEGPDGEEFELIQVNEGKVS
ncbi:hypothetical protein J6TS2_34250 [Heyndrickxia sporothermodurans]|nr:hypothetical protein J6TS2_34250 [Heyndrickxia sporothermodurans]